MASNQQNITGLLLAKREQVKALQDLGFADITESYAPRSLQSVFVGLQGCSTFVWLLTANVTARNSTSLSRSGRPLTMPGGLRSSHGVAFASGQTDFRSSCLCSITQTRHGGHGLLSVTLRLLTVGLVPGRIRMLLDSTELYLTIMPTRTPMASSAPLQLKLQMAIMRISKMMGSW